ncbi:YraN family protein [Pontivivens ytuae]|uniref:UPF0102 protein I0K15_12600 n=1 Tax=Pontivivens ytuae TaxID=2789856 RepID=A0A7S9LQ27_9RHOB|nr:YraN family protein [Pontivivens ytuae]
MSVEPRQLDFLEALDRPPIPVPSPDLARRRRGALAHAAGEAAEEAALRLYRMQGARLVARRFRRRGVGEIDLILELGGRLVFCEVKSRRTIEEAAAAITPRQWSRLEAAANAYIMEHGVSARTDLRFDVVLADRHGGVEILENAHPY